MVKNPNMERALFASELYRLGFTRADKGRDPLLYHRTQGRRLVEVQLWKDGRHRASHMVIHPADPNRKASSTLPTDFDRIDQVEAAVEEEQTRLDHPHGTSAYELLRAGWAVDEPEG